MTYWGLRDYQVAGQLGLEPTPEEYTANMVEVFREVRRVLRDDGTCWVNLGDSYATGGAPLTMRNATNTNYSGTSDARKTRGVFHRDDGLKPKDLCGIPWRVAFALQADGWWLRQDIIWAKPNPMPESVRDRCTKAHEYLFLLSKSERYYFDQEAIAEPVSREYREGEDFGGFAKKDRLKSVLANEAHAPSLVDASLPTSRNKRSVWIITTQPFPEAHFATFPPALVDPCIKAGSPVGGTVLDPFGGSGTTGLVADRLGRSAILIELNPEYAEMAERRIKGDAGLFAEVNAT